MNIFRYLDYRTFLLTFIEHLKKRGLKVNHSGLAEAIEVQKTYVSRVLRKQAHFNADQLFLCCKYLKLNAEETNYLLLLLEQERASVKERRSILTGQIHQIQQTKAKIQNHSRATMVEPAVGEQYLEYYLDPRVPLVHTCFHIESYRVQPNKIRQAMNMTEEQFKQILDILVRVKIIEWNSLAKCFDLKVSHLHLTKESPLSFPAEQLTRMMVLDHLKKLRADERLYYSFTFAADEKTRKKVHEEFLKFLRATEPEIRAAPSEEVFHMSFDLFSWLAGPASSNK